MQFETHLGLVRIRILHEKLKKGLVFDARCDSFLHIKFRFLE
jgi:hypothetical protein